ncbi:LCP family protein [Streptosporangium sp. CA-135522]|uniref:LCP family protein n=1 Tax=Streptosporangium sp. CA-135522 TaxID=3240072 RepID=UPI003D8CA3F7
MHLGQDSGEPAGDGGKQNPRRHGTGGEAQPGADGARGPHDVWVAGTPEAGPMREPEGAAEATEQATGPVPSGPPAPPPPGTAPKGRPQFAKPLTTGSLIGWTLLSAILPGAAHLRAGRRRIGYVLLGVFALLLVTALVGGLVLKSSQEDFGFFTRDSTLLTGAVVAGAGALCWFLLVLSSYITLRPNRLTGRGQIVSGVVVGLLCVSVMAPFALTANTVLTAKETANTIFQPAASDPTAVPIKHDDPWAGRDRVNFLLIGGDGAGNREGIRTDSMTVASVDVKTANTVMFSLPRNMQHVHFPPNTPLGKRFPNGFMRELPNGGLLNEVWQYGEEHPEVVPGKDGQRGARALMDAIGYTLNLKIDYYALINMFGFAHLVDAIGGLKIRVDTDVKWGGLYGTAGTIKAGYQTLSGEEALWYGRSRVGSDDFSRMARQRCVIGAFAQQATPQVVLTNFVKIANVAKRMARTNIPRELLEHVTGLAIRVKDARITSLQFVPPEFFSGSPDWQKIRTVTARALRQSVQPGRRALAAGVTASPEASGATPTPTPTPSRTATARPSETPTQNGKVAKSLGELCGF